jgi:hypothetical protein
MDDADLARRIATAQAIADNVSLPANIRAEARRALQFLRDWKDTEIWPEDRADLLRIRATKLPAHLRDADLIPRLLADGAVQPDDPTGTVTVRWDLIRAEDRAAAYSYLNELVDAYRGRSVGGRPKK